MKRLGALAKIERPSERVLRKIHGRSRQDRGKIAAVEPRSGRYFLGETFVQTARGKLAKASLEEPSISSGSAREQPTDDAL